MTTYYIKATGGSDANNGLTSAGAFATISKGCIAAVAGDTVVCLSGTYNAALYINRSNMRNGTAAAPITLKSERPQAAVFAALAAPATASGNDTMLESRCDWWIIDGFLFDAIKGYSGGPGTWAWILGGAGQYRQGVFYTGYAGVVQNCLIRNICLADPGGSGGAGAQCEGFYTNTYTPAGVSGWTTAQFQATNATIRYNTIHDTASSQSTNKSHGIYMTTGGSTLHGNIVYNVFNGVCIHGWHGFNGPCGIANNLCFHGTNAGILMGQGDGGAGTTAAPSNVKVFNNIVQDIAGGSGITTFQGSTSPPMGTGNVVANNLTQNNGTAYQLAAAVNQSGLKLSGPCAMVNYILAGGGDYHLSSGSTAIDRGVASLSGQQAPVLDIDGTPRPQGTKWDLGPYEFLSTSDTTPPTFVSAIVLDATRTVLTITMSETLGAVTPPGSAFNVGRTIASVSVATNKVTINVSVAFAFGDVITVQYTKPASSPWIQDSAGNAAASFGPNAVTNNIGAPPPPSGNPPPDDPNPTHDFGGHERKFVFKSR